MLNKYYQIGQEVRIGEGERLCYVRCASVIVQKKIVELASRIVSARPLIVVIAEDRYQAVRRQITQEGVVILPSETIANVIIATRAAIDDIAIHSRVVVHRKDQAIEAVINKKIYADLCRKHRVSDGFMF